MKNTDQDYSYKDQSSILTRDRTSLIRDKSNKCIHLKIGQDWSLSKESKIVDISTNTPSELGPGVYNNL